MINIELMRLLLFALVGIPIQTCMPQQPYPKPVKVYLLGVDSDLKGDFAQLGPALTAALQTAFSSEPGAFTLLDRTNLDGLVKANQLEEDLDAVQHGATPSPRLAHVANADIAHADGFIRSELRNGADGAVLSVALVKLDSEIPWSKQLSYTLAKWLSNDVQKLAANSLADDAAHKLFPQNAARNTSPPRKDLERQKTDPAADHQPDPGEVGSTEPNIKPTFVHGATLSPDTATAIAHSAQNAAATIVSCSAGLDAKSCVYYYGTKVASVRDQLQSNGIEFATLNDAIHNFETKPTTASIEHCADILRAVAKKLLDMARHTPSPSDEPTSLPSPEIEQPAGQFVAESYRLSAGVGQPFFSTTLHMISLPVTVESMSKSHFHFAIRSNSCYLTDEKGNTWTQDAPDSRGSYYPDSVGISLREHGIEIVPNVAVKSLFFFVGQGETKGTVFALVCSEESPTEGRQILIRDIKSH